MVIPNITISSHAIAAYICNAYEPADKLNKLLPKEPKQMGKVLSMMFKDRGIYDGIYAYAVRKSNFTDGIKTV